MRGDRTIYSMQHSFRLWFVLRFAPRYLHAERTRTTNHYGKRKKDECEEEEPFGSVAKTRLKKPLNFFHDIAIGKQL